MIGKNKALLVFNVVILLFSFQTNASMQNKADGESSPLFKRVHSKEGACYQITLNEKGFWVGIIFETMFLTTAALAQTGTKFEGFKASVFKPKAFDFLLRWGSFFVGYRLYQVARENQELERRCNVQDRWKIESAGVEEKHANPMKSRECKG